MVAVGAGVGDCGAFHIGKWFGVFGWGVFWGVGPGLGFGRGFWGVLDFVCPGLGFVWGVE